MEIEATKPSFNMQLHLAKSDRQVANKNTHSEIPADMDIETTKPSHNI